MDDLKAFGIEIGKGKYFEEAFYGIALVYTVLFDKIAKYLDSYGLTPAKLNVLMVIKHQGGESGLSQKDIGKRLMVSASNMTRVLEKLEREKLIERVGQIGDKRIKIIRVTKRGSQVLEDVWPGYIQTMKATMCKLKNPEQKILADLMLKWFRDLKDQK
ncbi:MAG: MarR family transcriptional regulator [Candidatus Omnitrophica bacterium]|nr:MarR family transcriptional regulator [Candidatus Omnitrophota bacterium]